MQKTFFSRVLSLALLDIGAQSTKEISFGFGGCMHESHYPLIVFDEISAVTHGRGEPLDAFFLLGDSVYQDMPGDALCGPCPYKLEDLACVGGTLQCVLEQGAELTKRLGDKFAQLHADVCFARFVSQVPILSIWDDHEFFNNYGTSGEGNDNAFFHAVKHEWRRHLDWLAKNMPPTPLVASKKIQGNDELYGSYSFGDDVELFLLDTRSHRTIAGTSSEHSMLGLAQKRSLLSWLRQSRAPWSLIVSSIPFAGVAMLDHPANPWPRNVSHDGWALYPSERAEILEEISRAHTSVVLISADLHASLAVQVPLGSAAGLQDCTVLELVSSPLGTGVLPLHAAAQEPEHILFSGASNRSFVLVHASEHSLRLEYFELGALVFQHSVKPKFPCQRLEEL